MSYSYTIPSSYTTQSSNKVKALRYANIEGSDNQLCLLEIDQYKLGISSPENIDPLQGAGRLENIIHPDTNTNVKVYTFTKSNSTIVRNVIKLFNDDKWIKECQFSFELKNDPLKISEVTHLLDIGNVTLSLYEYSEKFLVIFGGQKDLSIIPTGMTYNGYFINGTKNFGHGIAKSNKKIVAELKKLFNMDFESLYSYSQSSTTPSFQSFQSSKLKQPIPQINTIPIIPKGTNIPVPTLTPIIPKERTIKEDILSLFSKINSTNFETLNIMNNTCIFYGDSYKVEEALSEHNNCEILMDIKTKTKILKYVKFESI